MGENCGVMHEEKEAKQRMKHHLELGHDTCLMCVSPHMHRMYSRGGKLDLELQPNVYLACVCVRVDLHTALKCIPDDEIIPGA